MNFIDIMNTLNTSLILLEKFIKIPQKNHKKKLKQTNCNRIEHVVKKDSCNECLAPKLSFLNINVIKWIQHSQINSLEQGKKGRPRNLRPKRNENIKDLQKCDWPTL